MRYLLLLASCGLLCAQGTEPKPRPDDYDAHGKAKDAAIGAEFDVHSFSCGEQMFLAPDYLVVEVALYPPKGQTLTVQAGNFQLRLNGKKELLVTAAPSLAAASLQHPEWEQHSNTSQVAVGAPNGGVVTMGGPPVNPNPFPNSRPPGSTPPPIDVPPYNPAGIDRHPVKADELLLQTALPEGEHHSAVSGYLYFPYRGKVGSIKTIELLYEDAVLKLR